MANPAAGFKFKVRVNGAVLRVSNLDHRHYVGLEDASTSEGDGYEEDLDTLEGLEVTMTQAVFDPDDNPFVAPLFLTPRSLVDYVGYVNGVGGEAWHAELRVREVRHGGPVRGLQAVTIAAKANGPFLPPGY